MALSGVQDILTTWPGWTHLEPIEGKDVSMTGAGQFLEADIRPTLWKLTAGSGMLSPLEIKRWKANLSALRTGGLRFYGYDMTSYYPSAYPNGSWPTGSSFTGLTATIGSISDGKILTLENLPPGYAGSIGDMLSVTAGSVAAYALLQACEAFLANGSGITGAFEVRPYIMAAIDVDDVVAVKRPACLMKITPGSLKFPQGFDAWGPISFEAIQVFD